MRISDWSSDVCSSDLNRQRPSHKVDEQPLTVCEHQRHADVSQRKTLQYVDHGLAPVWWEHQGSRDFGCPASLESRHCVLKSDQPEPNRCQADLGEAVDVERLA